MVINCAFIGFGKSTTRYHLPYVLNRKDSWHVAHIFRRHAKPEEQAPFIPISISLAISTKY